MFLSSIYYFPVSGSETCLMTLNRYRLSRFFYKPELVFVALLTIYTILIGTLVVRI